MLTQDREEFLAVVAAANATIYEYRGFGLSNSMTVCLKISRKSRP